MQNGMILALALTLQAIFPSFWVQAPRPAPGFLSQPLATVQKSEFFDWFSLEKTAEQPGPEDSRVLTFRPSGEKFHDLVRVDVMVRGDSQQTIAQIDLILARSFIDSPSNGIFANDIAASFLRDAIPDNPAAKDLSDEIDAAAKTNQPMLTDRPAPRRRAQPGAGMLAFLGKRDSYESRSRNTALSLSNSRSKLRITVRMVPQSSVQQPAIPCANKSSHGKVESRPSSI